MAQSGSSECTPVSISITSRGSAAATTCHQDSTAEEAANEPLVRLVAQEALHGGLKLVRHDAL
jgi:hypothetical protein